MSDLYSVKAKLIIQFCNEDCGARICLTDAREKILHEKIAAALELVAIETRKNTVEELKKILTETTPRG